MKRRRAVLAIAALGAAPLASFGQPPKLWRIGMLETTDMPSNSANLNAFRQELAALGYVEGRNYVIEYRSSDGRQERFVDLAAELVRTNVDIILSRGTGATQAGQKATRTIPVVTTATGSPFIFAASLARPGGNVTGLSTQYSETQVKRLQLLREVLPGLTRVASLSYPDSNLPLVKEFEGLTRSAGIQWTVLEVRKREDYAPAFDAAVKWRAGALVVGQSGIHQVNGRLIAELAAKHRLPAAYSSREYALAGGLMSFGVNYPDLYRRSASYVDRIFKGAKPGDLPMEQPTKFDMVINLKTAKALGITIPQSVLLRADEVIQ